MLRAISISIFLETFVPEILPKLQRGNAEFLVFSAFAVGKFNFKLSPSGQISIFFITVKGGHIYRRVFTENPTLGTSKRSSSAMSARVW